LFTPAAVVADGEDELAVRDDALDVDRRIGGVLGVLDRVRERLRAGH